MNEPTKNLFYLLSTNQLIDIFSKLTGIEDLEFDPYLHGAGLHAHPRYGRLNMHLDYEKHIILKNKQRRLNIILFFTKDWKEEWNGDNQLWDRDMKECVVKTYPKFNSAIKSYSNLDLQFYNDESKKYNPNIDSFLESVDLDNYGSFLIDKVFKDSNYYLIFIEKIRLPNDDLFILEKERITRSLYIEKSENFINSLKKELVSDAEVKLNNKYFNDD